MNTTTHLPRIALMLGLLVSVSAFADDFNTVLKPNHQDSNYTETSLLSVAMPRANRNCGWSINDYVRNCGRSMESRTGTESQGPAVRS